MIETVRKLIYDAKALNMEIKEIDLKAYDYRVLMTEVMKENSDDIRYFWYCGVKITTQGCICGAYPNRSDK